MKSLFAVILAVFALQSASAQCIRSAAVVAPVVSSNAVATTLADTLSLLTVSSLLAETLPYNCPIIGPAPCAPIPAVAPIAPIAPVVGGCGCGGFGYPYGTYVV